MDSIGSRIKEKRKELHLTQTKIKELTGISSGNMSDYENGRVLPSALAIISLSKVLNCSTDWLLTGQSIQGSINTYSSEEQTLIETFRKLTDNDKEEILLLSRIKLERIENKRKECLSHSEATEIETISNLA